MFSCASRPLSSISWWLLLLFASPRIASMLCLGVLLAGFGRTMSWLFCDAVSTSCWESIAGKNPKAWSRSRLSFILYCLSFPTKGSFAKERRSFVNTLPLKRYTKRLSNTRELKNTFWRQIVPPRIVSYLLSLLFLINVHLELLRILVISSNTTSTVFVHVALYRRVNVSSLFIRTGLQCPHDGTHNSTTIPLVCYRTSHGSSLPHNDTYFI